MTNEMLTALIIASGALVGAVIGSGVSYLIARQQFKATVLSANRQQWINTLRDFIADFQTKVKIAITESKLAEHVALSFAANPTSFDEALKAMRLLINKTALLINPKEKDHAELLALMKKLEDLCINGDINDDEGQEKLQSAVTSIGQNVLKREWDRVKKGK